MPANKTIERKGCLDAEYAILDGQNFTIQAVDPFRPTESSSERSVAPPPDELLASGQAPLPRYRRTQIRLCR